jgi:Dolichyl-phosphate-mannose-protein mannosyltransferase
MNSQSTVIGVPHPLALSRDGRFLRAGLGLAFLFAHSNIRSAVSLIPSMREKILGLLQSPWLIAAIALLLRLAFLCYKITEIPSEYLAIVPFQNEVGNVAAALASNHGFCCLFRGPTGPTAWLSPVYPLLIAAIFKLFGVFTFRAFCASVFLNSLFSAFACFPLFHASERIAGKSTATLATWLWAFSPTGIILPFAWIWDSSLSTFFAAALLWTTLRLTDRPNVRAFALYGLLWGISLLTNPALGALLPFLLAWILYRLPANRSEKLNYALVSLAAILLCCLPWTARNYLQFHRFIPMRSNFPYEFWSGNNEIFDESSRQVNRITRYEQTHLYARLGETAFLAQKWQDAKVFVRAHPALYAQLTARRVVATWLGTNSPWYDFLHADSSLARFILFWSALSFATMLVGFVRLYRSHSPSLFPLAVFPVIIPVTFYLAHTSLRHRHPIDPILCLLMALAILGVANPRAHP